MMMLVGLDGVCHGRRCLSLITGMWPAWTQIVVRVFEGVSAIDRGRVA